MPLFYFRKLTEVCKGVIGLIIRQDSNLLPMVSVMQQFSY